MTVPWIIARFGISGCLTHSVSRLDLAAAMSGCANIDWVCRHSQISEDEEEAERLPLGKRIAGEGVARVRSDRYAFT